MSEKPWYKDGLKFECTQCGNCCTGAPGYVWVNKAEIAAMADTIGETDIEEFERQYVVKVGIRKSLREIEGSYDCVFLDSESRTCSVYNARPRQCRTWPFWNSNVRDEAAWERTCQDCPGAGKGKVYSLEHIEEQRGVFDV